jgi:hypothetical protein
MRDHHDGPAPYRLITTDDPTRTLGQGEVRYFRTLVPAANAFVNAPAPFRQIVYDDGCTARELDANEELFLKTVCNLLGHDLEAVEG